MRPFLRDALTLGGGSAAAQAAGFLLLPWLTRAYSPGDYGVYAALAAAVGLATPLAMGRYCVALMLPDEDRVAHALLRLCLGLGLASGLLAGAVTVLAAAWLPPLASWFPLLLVLSSWQQLMLRLALREGRFPLIASNRVLQAVSTLGAQLLLAGHGAMGLVAGMGLGLAFSLAVLAWPLDLTTRLGQAGPLGQAMRRYAAFPRWSLASTLMVQLNLQLPPLLLLAAFGTAAAGLFALLYRLVAAPAELMATSLGQVLFHRTARGATASPPPGLIPVIIAAAALAGLIGPRLLPAWLGPQWTAAGPLLLCALPLFAGRFLAGAFNPVLVARERLSLHLLLSSVALAASLVTLIGLPHRGFGLPETVLAFALGQAVTQGAGVWLASRC